MSFLFVCRFFYRNVCAVLLAVVGTCPLFANPDLNYETEKRIIQFLTWPAQNDVLQYEVRIDQLVQGRWQQVFQAQTEKPETRISLDPGQYRYRVDIIDLLGRRIPGASWSQLVVMRALQPEISTFSPVFHAINATEDLSLAFKGKAIELNAQVSLVSADGKRIEADSVSINDNKEGGTALFKKAHLVEGYWSLKIVNPGGLETVLPTLAIGKPEVLRGEDGADGAAPAEGRAKKLFSFSQGYALLLPMTHIYGDYFPSSFYPLGAHIRFAVLPFQKAAGSFGFELAPSWTYLYNKSTIDDASYTANAHFFSGALNMMYQKSFFKNRFALNARVGVGAALLSSIKVLKQEESKNSGRWTYSGEVFNVMSVMFAANLGFSFKLPGPFFIEADADVRLSLSQAKVKPLFVVPMIALGVIF